MFYPKSFDITFVWYVSTLGWTGGIACESAKIDLRQSDAYSMYYVGISGVREWIECIKWNALHMLFAEAKSHTHTHTRARARAHKMFVNIWYSIFDMCGMINFVGDVIWICKDRINTQIPIVLFKHHISNFGASRMLHSRKQCLLFIQAWTLTTQKWYQMIRDKTLFRKMYNNLLFIDDF